MSAVASLPTTKPFTDDTPIPTSVSTAETVSELADTFKPQFNLSRRSSLAAPPGLTLPSSNNAGTGKPMLKLTRAASVSFLPAWSNLGDSSDEGYLKKLADSTQQMQPQSAKFNFEFNRTTGFQSTGIKEYVQPTSDFSPFKDGILPQRRMSYNPLSGFPRARNVGTSNFNPLRSNGFNGLDNEGLASDNGYSRQLNQTRPFNSTSRRESVHSPTLITRSGSSTESLNPLTPNSLRGPRRFSLTPQFGNDYDYDDYLASQVEDLTLETYMSLLGRRHSVAASAFPIRESSPTTPTDPYDLGVQMRFKNEASDSEKPKYSSEQEINRNFNPYLSRMHGARPNNERYYIVEFKGNRKDAYYLTPDTTFQIKLGDLVIVEADRGKDLGKIVSTDVDPESLVKFQHEQQMAAVSDPSPRSFEPKRIYRHAQPNEVNMLVNKYQDEIKSLQMCQAKIRQHRLPMEVVDAEYQWDRRKLTFIYIATERIDFRELVRDLFKIYKTRIWMCAMANQVNVP